MARVTSPAQGISLSSTITTKFDGDGNHQESKSSNTGTGSLTFSVNIPAGTYVTAAYFIFTYNGSTTYGGSGKVNGTEYVSGESAEQFV